MATLIAPGSVTGSGYTVTFRQRVTGSSKVMLTELFRSFGYMNSTVKVAGPSVGYVSPSGLKTDQHKSLLGYKTKQYYYKTKVLQANTDPNVMASVNPDTAYFISVADITQYTRIYNMINTYVKNGVLELISVVAVP